MRNLYYYYKDGTLIFRYKDDCGNRKFYRFIFYTLKEALQKFRQDNNLRHKHIKVQRLY